MQDRSSTADDGPPRVGDTIRAVYTGVVKGIDTGSEYVLGTTYTLDGERGRAFYIVTGPNAIVAPVIEVVERAALPTPTEPTSIGAVVRIDGYLWTRIHSFGRTPAWVNERGERYHWHTLVRVDPGDAKPQVEILGPGYAPEAATPAPTSASQKWHKAYTDRDGSVWWQYGTEDRYTSSDSRPRTPRRGCTLTELRNHWAPLRAVPPVERSGP